MLTITSEGRLQQWQILTDSSPSFFAPHGPSTDPASVTTPSPSDPPTLWQRLLTLLGYPAIRPVLAETPPSSIPSNWLSEPSSALLPVQLPYSSTRHTVDSTGRTHLSSVTLSNDGRLIAVANSAGWVEIYQLQVDRSLQLVNQIRNGGTTTQISGDSAIVQQLAFSPDGRQVLAIVDDMTVRLWDVSSGQLIQVLRGHQANIQHAHFSPDGKWIVSASLDRTARIWDATSGQLIKTFFQSDSLSSANFSPDSQQIVTTSWDGMTRIFEISTGKQQRLLGRHHKAVLDAQFSPNGQFLVTASADGTARLWDVQTGTEQAELRPDRLATHPQPILHAFFSPDGQYIATLTEDGRVYLWAATWETLTKLAHDRSLRQLTPTECSQYLNLAAKECPVLRE